MAATVKPCGACGRRPVRSQGTGELRGWRYAEARVCSLRCVETLTACLLILEERYQGGRHVSLEAALRGARDTTLRIRQEERGEPRGDS